MFAVLIANWSSGAFFHGPIRFLRNFIFYTIWNETFVTSYFFLVVFLHPLKKRYSELLVCFQHQVVVSQFIVVVVYWTVLAPTLGLSNGKGPTMVYINIYKHSIPFLCILHEFLVTYGLYKNKGIWICLAIFAAYGILNVTLALGFDIVVYPTKSTDAHYWQAYPTMLVNLLIVVGVGKLAMNLKKRLVVNHYVVAFSHNIESLLRDADAEGPIMQN